MRTTLTKRAQTVVPAAIRNRYGIKGGDHLEWIDDGKVIKVIPLPSDAADALRGCAKGEPLLSRLLEYRLKERTIER